MTAQAGDIWIAKRGVYPVRFRVTATGGAAVPGSGGLVGFEYILDIMAANASDNVVRVPAA